MLKTPPPTHTLALHIYGMTLGSCCASVIFVAILPLGTGEILSVLQTPYIGDSKTCFFPHGFIRAGLFFSVKNIGLVTWRPASSGIVSYDYITLHVRDVGKSSFLTAV